MLIGLDASRANKTHKTGTEWYSYHLIRHLAKIDRENNYFLYSPDPLQGGLLNLGKNFHSKALSWPLRYLWTQNRLSLEMLRRAPDVLFVPAHAIPLIHPQKTITTIHDIAFEKFPDHYSVWQRLYLRWSTKYALKQCAKIITVSRATKNDLVGIYKADPEKIEVVPLGYDRENFKIIDDNEKINAVLKKYHLQKPFILSVGRLEKKKGTALLAEAFAKFIESQPQTKPQLVLVGNPGYGYAEIEAKIKKYKLQDKVKQIGRVGDEELPVLYNAAQFFVFPSQYEGFGLPLLEAMACGCPVLASDISSLREVGGEACYYTGNDPQKLSKALDKMHTDENLREKLRQEGLKRCQEFSWEECAEKTLHILEETEGTPLNPKH